MRIPRSWAGGHTTFVELVAKPLSRNLGIKRWMLDLLRHVNPMVVEDVVTRFAIGTINTRLH